MRLNSKQEEKLIEEMVAFATRVLAGTDNLQEIATLPHVLRILFGSENLNQ